MKKSLSILLIFAFFYSFIGLYLNFEIAQICIKEEIKEKIIHNLPESELTLIKIPSGTHEKIIWMEEGREFRYQGNMFDVVRINKRADTTYYYCFSDVKESTLMAGLDKLVKDQTDNAQSRTNQKKQEITYFFEKALPTQCLTEITVSYFNFSSRYKSIDTDVLSPPPRISG
jgi:hypothetical protein